MGLKEKDLEALRYAKSLLENPSLAARFTHAIGKPLEKGFDLLPANFHAIVSMASTKALGAALEGAVTTLDTHPGRLASNGLHKLAVAATGGTGGFFGLSGLAIELPVSTTLMLRSIADIARSEGEIVTATDTKLACVEVFALGGPSTRDDGSDTGYYAIRGVLAHAVAEAAQFITRKGGLDKGAPVIIRLIAAIASRFGTQVSQKVAAQAIPVIGAAGGALINTLFIDHFQDIARGHFIVRRLEREYGAGLVEKIYRDI